MQGSLTMETKKHAFTKRSLKMGLVSFLLSTLVSGVVLAAPSLENHEARIKLMEEKLDRVLELLIQDRQGRAATPISRTQTPARGSKIPAGGSLTRGLMLDIYTMSPLEKIPTTPTGTAVGRIIDENAPTLAYGRFLKNKNLAPLARGNNGRWIGAHWSGLWETTQDGSHVLGLLLEIKKAADTSYCVADLRVDGESLVSISEKADSRKHVDSYTFSDQGAIDLSPGRYALSIWLICQPYYRNRALDFSKVNITLKAKGPQDFTIEPILPQRLHHLR